MNGQRVIEQVAVLHDHLQRVAQVALVAEQQADFAEVRQLAQFGHAQAEALAVAGAGGSFQQVDHAGHRDTPVGVVEQRRAEAHLRQQCVGVEAQVAGHFQVVGQAGGADEGRHFYCYPYCSGNLALSGSSTRLLRQKALGLQVHGFYSLRVIN
ncbi:hypothetical protein D3C75_983110 [compost metagenome]